MAFRSFKNILVYYIDWFVDIEESLHPWEKAHLVMMYDLFNTADEWMRKLWYIYTMECYSAIKKNTFESVLMRWMKLEPIMQSEVSQKEKHQYSILTHTYGI